MNTVKRVILVDDHDMFREGIKILLNSSKNIEVVAEARNGKEFLDMINGYKPDAVLMDISMPVMNGIEATQQGIARYPYLKILALSMFGDEANYFKMVNAGAKGFVLKTYGIRELEKAIMEVSNNHNYFSKELLPPIITGINNQTEEEEMITQVVSALTKYEINILKLVVAGFSNEVIAFNMKIDVPTVKFHRSNLLSKASCKDSASLAMYVIKNKILKVA